MVQQDILNTSVVTYSYNENIAIADEVPLEMIDFVGGIWSSTNDPRDCKSGLSYFPNGESGWTLWVEEFNTESSTCTAPNNNFATMTVSGAGLPNVISEKKTSFCISYDGDDGWRGIIRGLYSSRVKFKDLSESLLNNFI